jgi:hypothetical protein
MKRDPDPGLRAPRTGTQAVPGTIDLYGRSPENGVPMLWKRAMQVVPVTEFERNGRWIKSGHYVISCDGDAIVAHCGNMGDDNVSVQFMHEGLTPYCLPRGVIEAMLLGKVMVSAEQQASVFEGRRLSDFFTAHGSPCSGNENGSGASRHLANTPSTDAVGPPSGLEGDRQCSKS